MSHLSLLFEIAKMLLIRMARVIFFWIWFVAINSYYYEFIDLRIINRIKCLLGKILVRHLDGLWNMTTYIFMNYIIISFITCSIVIMCVF